MSSGGVEATGAAAAGTSGRDVRSKCIKLLTQLLDRYADKPVAPYWAPLMAVVAPAAARLEVEVAGAKASGARTPATLELLTILAHHRSLTAALGEDARVLPGALRCIAAGRGLGGPDGPTAAALSVVEGLLTTAEAEAAHQVHVETHFDCVCCLLNKLLAAG
jgi:hypothetical protein